MQVCPSCGEENPPKFRVCGYCGTPLGPAPQEVRKTVTIVFSDLKGSTSLGEGLDSESLRDVMSRYFGAMRAELERHGGRIEKFIGDAVMAVFGLPKLHEDDALRAVRAAAGMQRALDQLNGELELRHGVRLANRTGVNTGEVVAGNPIAGERLVIGDAVNVAARLEQAAGECEVLLGELTYRLVRDHVEVESVGPLELKGKSEGVPAYRLVSIRDRVQQAPRRMPMVGRARELAQLADALAVAGATRAPRLAVVIGEAGVGKSRLTEELVQLAQRDGLVLRGRCLPYGDGITFWPLVEIVREAAGIADRDTADEARTKLATLAGDDDVAERVASALGLSPAPFSIEELFWGARKLLESLARQHPLVVVFDDVHWAEATFLDLIEHVLATAEDAPMLILCNARHELLERVPDWTTSASVTQIVLEPLTEAETGEFVASLLGDAGLDEAVLARIAAAAEGNPLFVEQMLSMLIDEGLLAFEDGRWQPASEIAQITVPPTIHALLAARLDHLEPTEQAVIEPASVIGYAFATDAVRALAPDEIEAQVPGQLESLAAKQLVRTDEELNRFGHILIRETTYERLLKRSRASLHERFVQWADGVNRDRATEYEEILGYHLEQARRYLSELGPLDDHGRAVGVDAARRLASAGRRAFARGDMGAAANLLGRASALLPERDPARLDLLPDLGQARFHLGEFSTAELLLEDTIADAEAVGDKRVVAHARVVLLFVRLHSGDERWNDEVAVRATEAIAIFERLGDNAGLAKAWRLLALAHANLCRWGDMGAASSVALDHARVAGDVRQQARAAFGVAQALLYGPTPVGEAIARCTTIAEQLAGDRQHEGLVLSDLAQLEAMRGNFERARALYRRARALEEELGLAFESASISLRSGPVELLAGNLEAAEQELRHGYETLERLGDRYFLPTIMGWLAYVLYEQDRLDEADAACSTAKEIAAEDDVWSQTLYRLVRAKLLARRGEFGSACALAAEAVELPAQTDATALHADALLDQAEVLRLSGQTAAARECLEAALQLAHAKGASTTAALTDARLRELSAQQLVG